MKSLQHEFGQATMEWITIAAVMVVTVLALSGSSYFKCMNEFDDKHICKNLDTYLVKKMQINLFDISFLINLPL